MRSSIWALDPEAVKGKSALLELWEAAGLKTAPARRHSDSLFVGRRRELAALGHQWRRVRTEGTPATALVLAEPGSGKTRLLAAFSEGLGAGVFWGRCLAYGRAARMRPRRRFSPPPAPTASSPPLLLRPRACERSKQRSRSCSARRPRPATAPSERSPKASCTGGSAGRSSWRPRRRSPSSSRTCTGPTRRCSSSSAASRTPKRPILILGSARPELLEHEPAFAESGHRRLALDLPPLTIGGERDAGGRAARRRRRARGLAPILRAAGGNPLFIEETVHMLADEGLLGGASAAREPAAPADSALDDRGAPRPAPGPPRGTSPYAPL